MLAHPNGMVIGDGGCCRERGHKFEPWVQLEADIGGHVVAANVPKVAVLHCREYMGGDVTGSTPMLDGVQVKLPQVVVVAIFDV